MIEEKAEEFEETFLAMIDECCAAEPGVSDPLPLPLTPPHPQTHTPRVGTRLHPHPQILLFQLVKKSPTEYAALEIYRDRAASEHQAQISKEADRKMADEMWSGTPTIQLYSCLNEATLEASPKL